MIDFELLMDRAVDLFKFWLGDPRTRIPKRLLLVGLPMLATPWWQPVLNGILVKHFGIDPRYLGTAGPWLVVGGWVLVGLGVLLYIRATWKSHDSGNEDHKRHDQRIFRESDEIMQESFFREFLDQLQTDDSYILSEINKVDRFCRYFKDTGNHYIIDGLSEPLSRLIVAVDSVRGFLAANFFVYPDHQRDGENLRFCLYPDLNIDRSGSGNAEEMARYDEFQKRLDEVASTARQAYKEYRLAVKSILVM